MATFAFGGFCLRSATRADLPLAVSWTAADPDHAGRVDPEFWVEGNPGQESYLLSDQIGPLFFFKMCLYEKPDAERLVEAHIQFAPRRSPEDILRTREGLEKGFSWLEMVLRSRGIAELFFHSKERTLIAFCVKHLKFARERDYLRKRLIA
jgi:hypothetical protein